MHEASTQILATLLIKINLVSVPATKYIGYILICRGSCMHIYIGAVSFNVETTLYFLKFNNLFVFFSCFCLRPPSLIGWSMLYRYYSDVVCKPTAREHRTYSTFFVLSTRRDWNVGKIIKHIHILFASRGQVDRIYLRDIYLILFVFCAFIYAFI
jgi:hypothetical protein